MVLKIISELNPFAYKGRPFGCDPSFVTFLGITRTDAILMFLIDRTAFVKTPDHSVRQSSVPRNWWAPLLVDRHWPHVINDCSVHSIAGALRVPLLLPVPIAHDLPRVETRVSIGFNQFYLFLREICIQLRSVFCLKFSVSSGVPHRVPECWSVGESFALESRCHRMGCLTILAIIGQSFYCGPYVLPFGDRLNTWRLTPDSDWRQDQRRVWEILDFQWEKVFA